MNKSIYKEIVVEDRFHIYGSSLGADYIGNFTLNNSGSITSVTYYKKIRC